MRGSGTLRLRSSPAPRLAQVAEEGPQVGGERVGLLESGEVAATAGIGVLWLGVGITPGERWNREELRSGS